MCFCAGQKSRIEQPYCAHSSCVNFGGLRMIQVSTIVRRAILHQYGRRRIVERWVVMMATKIHTT